MAEQDYHYTASNEDIHVHVEIELYSLDTSLYFSHPCSKERWLVHMHWNGSYRRNNKVTIICVIRLHCVCAIMENSL